MRIEDVLMGELTQEELHELVQRYDEGSIEWYRLLAEDKKNYPETYVSKDPTSVVADKDNITDNPSGRH